MHAPKWAIIDSDGYANVCTPAELKRVGGLEGWEGPQMYSHPQRRTAKLTQKLRAEAGSWLRELREKRGLSQREMAQKVGAEYYTFISQLENGRGRIPPDRYLVWAEALGVKPREFVRELMSYYDPITYDIVFGGERRSEAAGAGGGSRMAAKPRNLRSALKRNIPPR